MILDSVISAYNVETTITSVVNTVLASGVFRHVVVVDDGSSDRTAVLAEVAGARVVRLAPNRGRGEALLSGTLFADGLGGGPAEGVGFFDSTRADLSTTMVRLLVEHYRLGFDQVCGVLSLGDMTEKPWYYILINVLRCSVGQTLSRDRIVKRSFLDKIPESAWTGCAIEGTINQVIDRYNGSTCLVPLQEGVT